VDNRITVPVNCHVRIIVTASDVLHSFAVPSLGIKIDATPGRLNQASFIAERIGTFYGQCSEICGLYHGFMPIAVDSVSVPNYLAFLDSFNNNNNLTPYYMKTNLYLNYLVESAMFSTLNLSLNKNEPRKLIEFVKKYDNSINP